MKIEIRKTTAPGLIQITTTDERWYTREEDGQDPVFVPSVSWIASYYPKSQAFIKWVGEKGNDEAEIIKKSAGVYGSKVHSAISDLLRGVEVKIDAKYVNNDTEREEELTVNDYDALMSFVAWFNATKPEVLAFDIPVWSDDHNYAGTADMVFKLGDEIWVVDFKISASIWPSYHLQVSAYAKALEKQFGQKLLGATLQLNYKLNKNRYKFTEVDVIDQFPLFLAAQQIWANECRNMAPLQKDYPMSLKLEGVKHGQ